MTFAGVPSGTWTNSQPRRKPRPISAEGAERALLGHVLLDPSLAAELSPDIWSNDRHRHIHAAVATLANRLMTLPEQQRLAAVAHQLSRTGWQIPHYELTKWTCVTDAAPDPGKLIPLVTAAARRRRLAAIADQLHQAATTGDPKTMSATAQQAVDQLQQLIAAWSPLLIDSSATHD